LCRPSDKVSISLYVAMLDLEEFRAVQGSCDRALLQNVLRKKKEEIADRDEFLSGDYEPHLSVAEAIHQIIDGHIDRKAQPLCQFEHAAALIADTLGETLDPGPFAASRTEFWDEVNTVIRRKLRRAGARESAWPRLPEVLARGPLLRVPLDRENPLGTGYLTARQVVRAWRAGEALNLEIADAVGKLRWPEDTLEGARCYRLWFKAATAKGFGLFLHC
jgi:hypothetical protein